MASRFPHAHRTWTRQLRSNASPMVSMAMQYRRIEASIVHDLFWYSSWAR
jgi:hypothetical protein